MLRNFLYFLILLQLLPTRAYGQVQFIEGKDYFTYSEAIAEETGPDQKVPILFFFNYDCRTCSTALDILSLYAHLNPNRINLIIYPVAEEGKTFSAQVYYSLLQLGHQDSSEILLFETSDKQRYQELSNFNKLLIWIKQQGINQTEFNKSFHSAEVETKVKQAIQLSETYGVFAYPFVSIDGKYVLTASTLYNDDYSFAVLDFLLDKLQNASNALATKIPTITTIKQIN